MNKQTIGLIFVLLAVYSIKVSSHQLNFNALITDYFLEDDEIKSLGSNLTSLISEEESNKYPRILENIKIHIRTFYFFSMQHAT